MCGVALGIDLGVINQFNAWINDPRNKYIRQIRSLLNKYGTVDEINAMAHEAQKLSTRMSRLEALGAADYIEQIKWLEHQRDTGAFVSIEEFRQNVLGEAYKKTYFPETNAVTLEISSLNYFDWLMEAAHQALEQRTLLPTRYIVIRPLRDVELARPGELIAIDAALDVIGATHCIQMDTTGKNTGANNHAQSTDTMIGWLGGSGMPNEHVLMWIDELLYYYTTYGVDHILNVTPGTMLAMSLLYKMGHEGADPSIEATLEHPSNNLEFILPDREVLAGNHFEHMQRSFLYGVAEANKTAEALTRSGMSFIAASKLHRRY